MASFFQKKEPQKIYKALIFDVDDTLLEFSPGEENSLNKLHTHFFSALPLNLYKKTFHEINKHLWDLVSEEKIKPAEVKVERFHRLTSALNIPLPSEVLSHLYEGYLGEEVHWIEGVKETLIHLKKKHKIGVITNGLTIVQEGKRKLSGMHALCESFIISETVGIAKPNKAIFELSLTELGIEPHEALMIGDSLTSDYQGALNAGMDFCWVNPTNLLLPAHLPTPKLIVPSVAALKDLW